MMTTAFLKILAFVSFSLMAAGCGKDSSILSNKDFSKGEWLLVNINTARQTIYIISDRNILQGNPNGLFIRIIRNQDSVCCDGTICLYRNGEIVEECNYLNQGCLIESEAIKKAYRHGHEMWVDPKDKIEYKSVWDSLSLVKNTYSTKYIQKFNNKNVIRCFDHD
jgi:hypothetical protein